MELELLRGSCERGKVPLPWESPSVAGKFIRTDRELKGPGICLPNYLGRDRQELLASTSLPFPAQNVPGAASMWSAQALKAGLQLMDPWKGLHVGCIETAWRVWSVVWAASECIQGGVWVCCTCPQKSIYTGVSQPWEPHFPLAMVGCDFRGCKLCELEDWAEWLSVLSQQRSSRGRFHSSRLSQHTHQVVEGSTELHVPGGQPLGRSMEWFLSQQSTPVPPTLYHSLELDLGQTCPRRDLPERQAR